MTHHDSNTSIQVPSGTVKTSPHTTAGIEETRELRLFGCATRDHLLIARTTLAEHALNSAIDRFAIRCRAYLIYRPDLAPIVADAAQEVA